MSLRCVEDALPSDRVRSKGHLTFLCVASRTFSLAFSIISSPLLVSFLSDLHPPATHIKQESLGCDSVDGLFNDLYSKQIPVGSNLWKHLSTDCAVIEELSSFCNDTSCPGECHANVFTTACDNYLIWPYFHILCFSCTMILTCSCLVFIIHSSDACCSFRLSLCESSIRCLLG